MKKYFAFIAVILLALFFVNPQAAQSAPGKHSAEIWNPEKVDWWVLMNESSAGEQKSCEVHWLYDDSHDILLGHGDDRHLFFSFQLTPKNKEIKPSLKLKRGMAKEATIIVGGVKHALDVTDLSSSPVGVAVDVVMVLPEFLSEASALKNAERLLLKIDNTVYNFPLESIAENMDYFQGCLEALPNSKLIKPAPAPVVDLNVSPSQPGIYSDAPYDHGLDIEPLAGSAPPPVFANHDPDNLNVENIVSNGAVGKQADSMLDDVRYSGVLEVKPPRDKKKSESCPKVNDVYDNRGTKVIQNLTRKLAILEKEKEGLRGKLMGSSSHRLVVDMLECGSGSLAADDAPLSDVVIAKFESTIENLRAENELLNDALGDEAGGDETGELGGEVRDLKKKLNELIKRNHEVEGELLDYQLKAKEVVFEESVDVLDKVIGDNALADIVPKNPETMDSALFEGLVSNEKPVEGFLN